MNVQPLHVHWLAVHSTDDIASSFPLAIQTMFWIIGEWLVHKTAITSAFGLPMIFRNSLAMSTFYTFFGGLFKIERVYIWCFPIYSQQIECSSHFISFSWHFFDVTKVHRSQRGCDFFSCWEHPLPVVGRFFCRFSFFVLAFSFIDHG